MRFLPRLVGITGLAGCGKDTVAKMLADQHRYHIYRLAQPLKDALNEMFGWRPEQWEDREWKERTAIVSSYQNERRHFDCYSPRQLAQWLGTEVGRTLGGEDVWVNLMERHWLNDLPYDGDRMVVPDVRFDNEAARIRQLGGVVIQVVRAGLNPVNDHASERGVSPWLVNARIINDQCIKTLCHRALYELERLAEGG